MKPFERVTPGEPISASEYNRAMAEIERQSRRTVTAPLTLTSDASGVRLGITDHPHIWVQITGHNTTTGYAAYGTSADAAKYSGVEQTHDTTTDAAYELPGGIKFYVDALYLKEVNGRTDVPEGSIVRAYQSDNGSYYTFLFEEAFNDYGTGDAGCPVWSCHADFNQSAGTFAFGSCPGQEFWTFDGVNPTPNAPFDWCGCVSDVGSICWPAWGSTDLQSTGISIACLLACSNGQIVPRRACLTVVPGGPFGLRLALISQDDGHELHTPTDA